MMTGYIRELGALVVSRRAVRAARMNFGAIIIILEKTKLP